MKSVHVHIWMQIFQSYGQEEEVYDSVPPITLIQRFQTFTCEEPLKLCRIEKTLQNGRSSEIN